MDIIMSTILSCFDLDSDAVSCIEHGQGHIHKTFRVTTQSGKQYILQKINEYSFRDQDILMQNIANITEHLRSVSHDPRSVMSIIRTVDGKDYLRNSSGCWRMYDFIEGAICLERAENDSDYYEVAYGFGRFQEMLKDFPAKTLHESIPNFHNTPDRYRLFRESIKSDVMGRAKYVQPEIEFILSREEEISRLQAMRDSGELPTRVTHNDTKLNNVLLDQKSRKALCVIDLDTVMPGLSLYDYGDLVRFGAATAAEDEKDLSKVSVSLKIFEILTRGYIDACTDLTAAELEYMPLGAKTITLECGMRFLTDYLDGDRYFSIHREGHNLDRARTQLKLVSDMESKWNDMCSLIETIR